MHAAAGVNAQPGRAEFFGDLEMQIHAAFRIKFAEQDAVGRGHYGLSDIRVPPLPSGATSKQIVAILQGYLPAYKIWRDRVDTSIVHIEARQLLHLKNNPLDKRFNLDKKNVSIEYLETHTFTKLEPRVRFFNCPMPSQALIPFSPDLRPFKAPLDFNLRKISLRRFLTTGIKYNHGGDDFGAWLWQATYQLRNGRLTGRVQVILFWPPEIPPRHDEIVPKKH